MKIMELGKVAKFVNGYAFKPSDWASDGMKIIRIQNLTNLDKSYNRTQKQIPEKYRIQKGDVLVSWSATLDVFEWEDNEDGLLNQHIFKIEHNSQIIDKKYLKYVLRHSIERMLQFTHGSTMKHIVREDFLRHKIPLPPLDDQERVVKVLDQADVLLQERRQAIGLLDDYLKSVFLEMFGDPLRNPNGFKIGAIADLVSEVKYGTSAKASDDGHIPYLRMNNITYSGELDLSDLKHIDLRDDEKEKYLARKGDLLFNRTNSKELVGKSTVYDLDEPMAIAGYLIRVRTNSKALPEYISGYLNSDHGKKTLRHMCKSIVGMANINARELQNIKIVMPPIGLQEQFRATLERTKCLKQKMLAQSDQLENQFQALMQKAFKGDI